MPYLKRAVTDADPPDRAPLDHLQELFDLTANNYDAHLKSIGNAGPRQIADAIDDLELSDLQDQVILDAGCGTGLCGELLRPQSRFLVGVDISRKMLEQARERGCYDSIVCSGIVDFTGRAEMKYDLVVLSDVFVYFGALDEVLENISLRLNESGHIVFSVETLNPSGASKLGVERGYKLAANGRYSHTPEYIDRILRVSGFKRPRLLKHDILRQEFGNPVECMVVAAGVM
ncbi:MAG: methyltransferase domain-containing protein [Pyrinomonadaceae bacterium]|nr:methyltransferase domain-containing protein [Pyrinomonadaceae bacterium]